MDLHKDSILELIAECLAMTISSDPKKPLDEDEYEVVGTLTETERKLNWLTDQLHDIYHDMPRKTKKQRTVRYHFDLKWKIINDFFWSSVCERLSIHGMDRKTLKIVNGEFIAWEIEE